MENMQEYLKQDPIVIVDATRTPMGAFQGVFSNTPASDLGSAVIKGLLAKNNLDANGISTQISEVIMGCVLPAGQGQAPARQAALKAGLDNSIPCTTINKMCGSGIKSIIFGMHSLLFDSNKIIVAGGMENMTLAPYLLPAARSGLRLGHGKVIDHMFYDGLEDAYNPGLLMGHFAERTAAKFGFSRQAQDEYAKMSATRALDAIEKEVFNSEISKVAVKHRGEENLIAVDEVPQKIRLDKIPHLKPAFMLPGEDLKNGTVTAANSSSIADGASAVLMMRQSKAKSLGLKPRAKIVAYSEVAGKPEWFTTAPVTAINNLLASSNHLTINDIDLFEINEAFAVVTMTAISELKLDQDKVNIYGGACALGHPIGATGARIVTTLLNAMQKNNKAVGMASLCIGGGEAIAMALELVD